MARGAGRGVFEPPRPTSLAPDPLNTMGNLGLSELLVIFVVALLVIGPRRLPELARALGEAFRSFQDAIKGPSKGEGG